MPEPLDFSYDEDTDVLTIEGIDYAGLIFRKLGMGPFGIKPGCLFRLIDRRRRSITIQDIFPHPPNGGPDG